MEAAVGCSAIVLFALVVAFIILWVRVSSLKREIAALRATSGGQAPTPVPTPVRVEPPKPVPIEPPKPAPVAQWGAGASPARAAEGGGAPSPPPKPKRPSLDIEQMLGANWLSKIGVAILVLGMAFFLAWQLRELGPAGKITVGAIVSAALLGAGIWGERFERYRILARAGLAGGWSLLFFTAYAAHHIKAARVIASPLLGFALMLVVVVAMVAHTLRFRSQVVTGLAFTIAFTTVALNRVDVYSLTANVALAIGFVIVIVRMRWFALEILGIVATYLNHYVWLVPIIAPMNGKVHPFPQFYASAAILIGYWVVFRASYIVRPPTDEKTSAYAGVLNSALLLAVMKYQSAHPELAFQTLLTLGLLDIALARLPIVRRKRMTFLVLTSVGTVLAVAAIPFRYAGSTVSPIWLLESALLVVTGIVTSERAYRRLGSLAFIATAVQMLAIPGTRLLGARLGDPKGAATDWVNGAIFAAAMLLFYATSRLNRELRETRYLSYLAALMGLIAGWAIFPRSGAAVTWIVLGVAIAYAGRRWSDSDLTIESNALAIAATLRVLVVNLPTNDWRVTTVAIVAAGIYLLSRWNWTELLAFSHEFPAAATWVASAVVGLLAWYQLLPIGVAIAWAIAGVLLIEIQSKHLRWQGMAFLVCAFARVFIVNLNAAGSERVYTIVPIAIALLYAYEGLQLPLFAWLSMTTLVALLRFGLAADVVAIAWAALTLVLVAVARFTDRRVFLHIGIATSVITLIRAVIHNLYERSYFPPPANAPRWLLISIVSALLLAALPFAFRLRDDKTYPHLVLFFPPILLITALLGTEMRKGMLTMAWGIEGVVVFLLALWAGERVYRLTGLAILLLCVGKIFVFDFWTLTLRDKALTGIVVGVALIGVSILYTKKRETILQFL